MSNSILTISMITREALRVLENNLTFAKGVNREYDDQFAIKGAKIGSVVNIRKPARYIGRSGSTLQLENQTETYSPLTLTTQRGVDVQFTSADLKLSLDDFSTRFLKPALANVANRIDYDGMQQYLNVANSVGTLGTPPTAISTYLSAMALLDTMAAPRDGQRSIVISPYQNSNIVANLTTLFNPSKTISEQYETGNMGMAIGAKWSMDQNCGSQTVGAYGTPSPTVATAPTLGATTIATQAWTSSASAILAVGDVVTFAGCYAVNPQTRTSTGQLQQFVLTAPMVNDGSGNSTLSVYPAFNASGQFQNITAYPAPSAAIVVYNAQNLSGSVGLCYHKDAFVLGCADLDLPKGVDMAARISDPQLGLSVRMVRAYDIVNDMFPCRLDVLYGWQTVYPELACRIHG